MQITVSGQHIDVTAALKEYVSEKLQRIERHFDHVIKLSVVLSVEKNRHSAEANVTARGVTIHANAQASDMYVAIDALADKLDRQVLKHKEKTTNHHQGLKV